MDKASLLDLMAFTGFAWADVEKTFASDNERLVKAAPGSGWPALRNCLAHILLGNERWNAAILQRKTVGLRQLGDDELRTWADLNAYRKQTSGPLREFIEGHSEDELQEKHEVDCDGNVLMYSVADLTIHLVLHEISHHGDISTLMYQLGMEPWVPYYRFYVNPDA